MSVSKKERNSNLELYRIIVMLLIIAHHYVVHSGLNEYLQYTPQSLSSSSLILLGGWGKTGIDCFVLITGYFMCKSNISFRKFIKLYSQICFYTLVIYLIFCATEKINFSVIGLIKTLFPFKTLQNNNFPGCFLIFYLFIPFLNILINSLDYFKHRNLIILLLLTYTIIPSIPGVPIDFNYISWFMVLYLISAYIRLYGLCHKITTKNWGWISIILIIIGSISVIGLEAIYKSGLTDKYVPYYFLYESNRLFPLLIAVSSFMYFKDLKIPHIPFINIIASCTFGVLLIHDNSNAIRHWLWYDVIDCIGHYEISPYISVLYALGCIVIIFTICAFIDFIRSQIIECIYLKPINALIQFYKRFTSTPRHNNKL